MGRIACDASDWFLQSQPGQRPRCHTCLTAGQSIGLAFSAFTGAISLLFVVLLFTVVTIRFYHASSNRRAELLSYLDIFLINLFVAEVLMSFGGLLDAGWANQTQVYCGDYCTAQGTVLFIGETAVSIWTFVITIYTWICVVRGRRVTFHVLYCLAIMGAVWGYVLAFHFGSYATIKSVNDEDPHNYMTPATFWCWINSKYTNRRLGEYIWLWIAGVGNIAVYVSLFLILQGNIAIEGNDLRTARWHSKPPPRNDGDAEETDVRNNAAKILWYPISYTILVLPPSILRWMGTGHPRFSDPQLPDMSSFATAQLVFHALFRLSAAVNVTLVLATRPNVLLLGVGNQELGGGGQRQEPRWRSNESIPVPPRSPTGSVRTDDLGNSAGFGGPRARFGGDEAYGRI